MFKIDRIKVAQCPFCLKISRRDEDKDVYEDVSSMILKGKDIVYFTCENGHTFFVDRSLVETEECHGCKKRISEGYQMSPGVWYCEECHKKFWKAMNEK